MNFSVTQNGKELLKDKYIWNEKTRTFSTTESNLVLDFNGIDNCTFDTGSYCTFDTGSDCVIVRRDIFEVIKFPKNITIQLCPYRISGFIKDGYYYKNGKKQYPAIIADGILSEVINHKGNVYKVRNNNSDKITYLVQDGDIYSHGDTLKEAKDSLIYKISNRDTSEFEKYKLDDELDKITLIRAYRAITGACEAGTRYFCENTKLPEKCTIRKAIELTQGQYGNDKFREFFISEEQ